MTLKYESEILFDLMKRDGDDTPSDVLPYESELKEKYLQQVEGAYPKLQDYRPEWLNYNLVAHLPADFPVETLSNVTSAKVDDVVPYAYGSAILKGNTLINVAQEKERSYAGIWNYIYIKKDMLIEGKKYFVKVFNMPKRDDFVFDISNYPVTKYFSTDNKDDYASFVYEPTDLLVIHINNNGVSNITDDELIKIKIVIIEYQDGMENWDIPYFEGMKSVQMPVLTTTGKNLFDGISFKKWWVNASKGVQKTETGNNKSIVIKIKPNTKYRLSGEGINRGVYAFLNANFEELSRGGNTSGTRQTEESPYGSKYLLWYLHNEDISKCSNIQVEEGEVATSYEPYKSNILSCNEEVELRGIGNVKDTLDCLTGEVTQRIGEIVLDGSENWVISGSTRPNHLRLYLKYPNLKHYQRVINDKFADNGDIVDRDIEGIYMSNTIDIQVEHSRLSEVSVNGFKNWLRENNIKVQAILSQESIKTVDLTVTEQDGNTTSIIRPIEGTMHLMTEGEPIKPLFSGEVPVEAITQNLSSFIEEE